MPYDPNKDPTNGFRTPLTLARKQAVITPSDSDDLDPNARFIECVAAGNIVYLPLENADGSNITITSAAVGWKSSCAVRRVLSTGTTATVVACND